MTDDSLDAFLAGERPDDVAIFVADRAVNDPERLLSYGTAVDGGVVLVLDGETGRNVFRAATGTDAMAFAKEAMGAEGEIGVDLSGGRCPDCGEDAVRLAFSFAEEQNDSVGGLYAEGDVIHAYARCDCGAAYAEKWVADER